MVDPQGVLEAARINIGRWKTKHLSDGMVAGYLDQWSHVLGGGVDSVAAVLTGVDEVSVELRQNAPFAGVLSAGERRQVLSSFRQYWKHTRD